MTWLPGSHGRRPTTRLALAVLMRVTLALVGAGLLGVGCTDPDAGTRPFVMPAQPANPHAYRYEAVPAIPLERQPPVAPAVPAVPAEPEVPVEPDSAIPRPPRRLEVPPETTRLLTPPPR